MQYPTLLTAIAISLATLVTPSAGHAQAIVPGLKTTQLNEQLQGLVLFEEHNCVACHATEASFAATSKVAPRLTNVGQRVNPHYLESFLQSPHTSKPGTTMPDVLSHLDGDEKQETAKAITHFLISLDKRSSDFNLQVIDTVAAEYGKTLFHTVGCVACHSPRDDNGSETLKDSSAPLGDLEKKYTTKSLADFLSAPHRVRPSGRMPDLRLQRRDVERIANYLLSKTKVPGHLHYTLLKGRVAEGLDVNVEKVKAGHVNDFKPDSLAKLQHNSAVIYEGYYKPSTPGDFTFFLEMNGGELLINDQSVINQQSSSRAHVKKLKETATLRAGWNKIKLTYIHAGRDPRFLFEIEGPNFKRQAIPPSQLSISDTPIAPHQPYPLDQSLVEKGKQAFATHGCVKCHNDVKVDGTTFTPLAKLNTSNGCLSDKSGPWPRFPLSTTQKGLIRAIVPKVETTTLSAQDTLHKSLATFNCIACHDRADVGGVTPERNEFFTGTKKELGNQGRVPPPLTHVGAKLQKDWLNEVVLRGRGQRDYLNTTMPVFGEANVGHLPDLFEKIDEVEPVTFAKIDDAKKYKAAGHELVGTTGFSCIACHDFNGQKAPGPGAFELIDTTQRLQKDYFYHFMLNPARFRPNTVMPSAWPNGHVFKEHLLGGDAKKQIESVWIYLEDGRRAKNPIGLSRKSPELRVTDETVICRGRGNAGYRGIAVGYPGRISLAFDSLEMNLRLMWKGDFASVNNGSFQARGSDRIDFPQGIPFHRLKSMEDDWPYKRKTDYLFPQDHGYQFRGYYLDKQKRPTFMYRYGDIKVEEFYEDLLDDQKNVYFHRTFTFDAPAEEKLFYLRAASAGKITKNDDNSFAANRLTVRVKDAKGIIRDGETQELLIPLTLPQGKSTLTLDYQW